MTSAVGASVGTGVVAGGSRVVGTIVAATKSVVNRICTWTGMSETLHFSPECGYTSNFDTCQLNQVVIECGMTRHTKGRGNGCACSESLIALCHRTNRTHAALKTRTETQLTSFGVD